MINYCIECEKYFDENEEECPVCRRNSITVLLEDLVFCKFCKEVIREDDNPICTLCRK